MDLTSRQKYNRSEKGKKKNAEYQAKRRRDPKLRHHYKLQQWTKRGLKYYPEDICEKADEDNNCFFCNIKLKKSWMEHNHITGSFRGFTCSSCNTHLGITDKNFNLVMKELTFVVCLPKIISRLYKNGNFI